MGNKSKPYLNQNTMLATILQELWIDISANDTKPMDNKIGRKKRGTWMHNTLTSSNLNSNKEWRLWKKESIRPRIWFLLWYVSFVTIGKHCKHKQKISLRKWNENRWRKKKQTQNVNENDERKKMVEKGWPSQGMHVKIFWNVMNCDCWLHHLFVLHEREAELLCSA